MVPFFILLSGYGPRSREVRAVGSLLPEPRSVRAALPVAELHLDVDLDPARRLFPGTLNAIPAQTISFDGKRACWSACLQAFTSGGSPQSSKSQSALDDQVVPCATEHNKGLRLICIKIAARSAYKP